MLNFTPICYHDSCHLRITGVSPKLTITSLQSYWWDINYESQTAFPQNYPLIFTAAVIKYGSG